MKLVLCVMIVCGLCHAAPAQDARPAPGETRAEIRERLERRLAQARRIEEELERAIARLDARDPFAADPRPEPDGPHRRSAEPRPQRQMQLALPGGQSRGPGRGGVGGVGGDVGGGEGGGPDRERIFRFLEQHAPLVAERIGRAVREDPALARRVVEELAPRIGVLLAERDAEAFQLRLRELRLSQDLLEAGARLMRALRTAGESPQLSEARAEIRSIVGAMVDLRAQVHQHEIARLERRLEHLRAELSAGIARRDAIVERRAREIERMARERTGRAPPR